MKNEKTIVLTNENTYEERIKAIESGCRIIKNYDIMQFNPKIHGWYYSRKFGKVYY